MAAASDTASMALFCDFENIALGVRDVQYDKFDIRPVLERLLAKGSIVVKKAYCDWDRYKSFKAGMHEANFELIEIPHVRQSGKNSADIRMVVDALDLCYTKAHVDTFVIISGDSDFSPLVSKLRENAKKVIGVGVKQSCSDLLVTNCDEFIYYDDLVRDREASRGGQRREREKRSPEEEAKRSEKMEARKRKALDLVAATFTDLMADRGEAERVWASVLKEVLKRRNPGFSESYFGFRTFGNLLEEAASQGILVVGRDDKSGTYVTRAGNRAAEGDVQAAEQTAAVDLPETEKMPGESSVVPEEGKTGGRRRGGRRSRKDSRDSGDKGLVEAGNGSAPVMPDALTIVVSEPEVALAVVSPVTVGTEPVEVKEKTRRGGVRRSRKKPEASDGVEMASAPSVVDVAAELPATEKPPVKRVVRSRKPKKIEESGG
ncbi:NYN domain-containing protein [Azonexus sp.]|uniref:NYN domain-containing protein n=1 Tax=Azonexus sp. TaxID=1872668 RepID=UPI0027B89D33|nr:NYN domain-containing protein [Azonexus sp.]